ncbi:sensor histidine kinase [Anaerococcus sp. ENR1011]|uniref:histidine kinase n=1 Tax=Anaerococcus groningensis TaxID=3115616 RepID=A0ABW9MZD3_9FIRM
MKGIYKFLKEKIHSIIIFLVYILILLISTWFGISKNYILYIILISIFMFAVNIVISFVKYKRLIDEINQWSTDLLTKEPDVFKNTNFSKRIVNLEKENREMESAFELKMKDFKEYISIWTHQIKTPLFSLDLILNDHPIDSNAAKNEVFEIEEYIDNLLSYMRLESLSTDFVFEEVSLDDLVSSSIKKYSKVFIRRKNKVDFKASGLIIATDKKWFSLILDQILSNANKYTQNGCISIYIEGTNLVIKDTGIGIRKEDLPRVFDKSYTGYNGRIYKKSTGIGLNLVKNTAENLSIDVFIESEVDVGTKVILNLSRVLK